MLLRQALPSNVIDATTSSSSSSSGRLLSEQFDSHHPLSHLSVRLGGKYQRTLVGSASTNQQPRTC